MSDKTVNYTPEMTAALVDAYKASPTVETVEAFAAKFGKTQRSIIAKLSRAGVYVSPASQEEKGERVKKNTLIDTLTDMVGLTEAEATSLEKASRAVLTKVIEALRAAQSPEA